MVLFFVSSFLDGNGRTDGQRYSRRKTRLKLATSLSPIMCLIDNLQCSVNVFCNGLVADLFLSICFARQISGEEAFNIYQSCICSGVTSSRSDTKTLQMCRCRVADSPATCEADILILDLSVRVSPFCIRSSIHWGWHYCLPPSNFYIVPLSGGEKFLCGQICWSSHRIA